MNEEIFQAAFADELDKIAGVGAKVWKTIKAKVGKTTPEVGKAAGKAKEAAGKVTGKAKDAKLLEKAKAWVKEHPMTAGALGGFTYARLTGGLTRKREE